MNNINDKTEMAVIEKTIFDTMYKKKITLKDALYTKGGFFSLLVIAYLAQKNQLQIVHNVVWIIYIFFIIKRSTVLAHTKDRHLWGKQFLFQLFSNFQKKKERHKNKEVSVILEACKKPI